jgi:hypothetical protein
VPDHGRQSIDPPVGTPTVPSVNRPTEKVQGDVSRAGLPAGALHGGGTLFTEPVLVVNQKPKLIEVNEYAVYDQQGTQVGAVRQVGQSMAKKLFGVVADVDQYLTVGARPMAAMIMAMSARFGPQRSIASPVHALPRT